MIYDLARPHYSDAPQFPGQFLIAWPYMSGDSAQYLLDHKFKGMGIDGLSISGYPDPHAESDAHKLLLGAQNLLLENIHIPDALPDGKRHYFAAFPILVANADGTWTRPIEWDAGDLDSDSSAPDLTASIPPSIAASMAFQRSTE